MFGEKLYKDDEASLALEDLVSDKMEYDAKFSKPDEGVDVVEDYEEHTQREIVITEAGGFANEARKIWYGQDRAHYKNLRYQGLAVGAITISATAYAVFFLSCFISDFVTRNGGQVGGVFAISLQVVVALLFIGFFLMRDRRLQDRMEKMRQELAQHYDSKVEQLYHKGLSDALNLLPTVGVNDREANRAAELLIDIFTYWRILERIPNYIGNSWLFDRMQAREARDVQVFKWATSLVLFNGLLIAVAVGFSVGSERVPLLQWTGGIFKVHYFIIASSAALIAGVGYFMLRRKWRNNVLLHVNAGLSVSDDYDEALKRMRLYWEKKWDRQLMPVDWPVRIAEMDPTKVITKNYRDIFHAYMKASAS